MINPLFKIKEVIRKCYDKIILLDNFFKRYCGKILKGILKQRYYVLIGVRVLMVLGVILTYGNYNEWFLNKDRVNLYNKLTQEPYKAELSSPGVEDFIKNFYNPLKATSQVKASQIKGLRSTWVSVGNNKPMAGNVHLWFSDDRQSTSLGTFDELRDWATKSPLYEKLSLILLVVSIILEIFIDIQPWLKRKLTVEDNSKLN